MNAIQVFRIVSVCFLSIFTLMFLVSCGSTDEASQVHYPLHRDITATLFWVGEEANADNDFISNASSCWDDLWMEHYGGIDSPNARVGYLPSGFMPQENPFYVALPYTDFDYAGRKINAVRMIPWAHSKSWGPFDSMCKNQWVRISKGSVVVYAQWEDSGPFQYDDTAYVFGTAQPKNTLNENAGIDVSPAVNDYLGLNGMDAVNWQFVPATAVPNGPWKDIITSSQIFWE